MALTVRRVLAPVLLTFLVASTEGRALSPVVKVGPETDHIDLTFTFGCSTGPISVRFVGRRTFSTTYHYGPGGELEIARQHNVAKFDHYDPDTGEKLSHDNWTITLTADYAEHTTTVTGAFWKTNGVGSGGPVIRDVGRIVFDQPIADVFALDALWSAGELNVIDSSGPHEYFNMTVPWPQMYCEADGGD
jgi:hypothetical protein